MAEKTVIDVSVWQGNIDWDKVKSQIDGAIIRIGYGSDRTDYDDKYAKRNIAECERLGIPWGPYIYSYASTVAGVQSEYAHMKRVLQGHNPSYPWYIDLEENKYGGFARTAATEWAKLCKKDGHKPGVYTGSYYFKSFISGINVPGVSWWIAAYGTNNGTPQAKFKPSIGINYDGWQYTSVKKFNGISGGVDTSLFYKNYGTKMQTKPSVNTSSGSTTPAAPSTQTPVAKKSIEEVAKDVISGKYGNGEARIKKLAAEGYDANAVQKKVNELLNKTNSIVYIVKRGDTLSTIAKKYGVPYTKIARDNGISNANLIRVGQKLTINR